MEKINLFVDQDKMLDSQRRRYDLVSKFATKRELDLLMFEASGGDCEICAKSWEPVVVKNPFADFTYFTPGCHCWKKCGACGTSLHGVTEPGRTLKDYRCPSCGNTGIKHWALLCRGCGQVSWKHDGDYYKFYCSDCKRQDKRSRKDAMDIGG